MDTTTLEPGRWSLQDLLTATEGPEMDRLLTELEQAVSNLESSRERLSPDVAQTEFARLMGLLQEITALSSRLNAYGHLWFAADTQNQDALAFRGRMDKRLTDLENRILFFSLWWKGLDDDAAERLLAASGDNRYYLESLRHFKPHTLSEPEEKVINLKDINGIEALVTVYEMLTNGFTFRLEIDGQMEELNRSQLMVYARHPSSQLRAAAYQELYRVFGEQANVLGQIYQHVVRDWASENLALRRFASAISVRNLGNDIPDTVVDTLLQVCRQNAALFQRYFRLKARWLGMDRLRRYDIYAPLSASEKTYTFDQAARMALDSLRAFSPTLADHAWRIFQDNHLDSETRPGKNSGAFCYSALPGLTPWVLINYNGKPDDVATLAHELGHAIHALMAADHSALTFHSALPLAETASTFAEMLLLERLLQAEDDPALRRDILARSVDDAYATVMRQAYFVLFERQAHTLIEQGCTHDELAERYLDNLREQFGDAVELSDEFRWEWVSIPHIFLVPFYCYAYSFGQLLVLSLYRQFKQEGASFIPRYLNILAYGGSANPTHILSEAGIDITSAAFWQGGFDVIAEMIQQLESLAV
ncbi:MAG: M3 family oligoendopeptidase [Chloroflexota bacterium]